MKIKPLQIVGVLGTLICIILFAREPSFPTPDKLLVFLVFVFMIFGKAWQMFKRLGPFVALLLVYESFRGIVPHLNTRVEYLWMPHIDRLLFGDTLPTITLQNWLWHGTTQWYDFVFYLAYMLHFILPLALALIIWRYRDKLYWQFVATYLVTSFTGFLTFLFFPAAPPWMASQMGLIEPVSRISSSVWFSLGLHDFPSVYSKISPNPVAAVPSLHAAYATLFTIFVIRMSKSRWRFVSLIYPFLIYVGTVYQGEHYAIDEIIGGLYAAIAYLSILWIWPRLPRIKSWIVEHALRRAKASS